MRTYSAEIVEKVTGIKGELIRTWEKRDIYQCELRRDAISTIPRHDQNDKVLAKLNAGWRTYTFGDLVRLSMIRELTRLGLTAKASSQMVEFVSIENEETWRERRDIEQTLEPTERDEFLHLHTTAPQLWHGRSRGPRATHAALRRQPVTIVLNMSDLRSMLLERLDQTLGDTK